MRACGAMAAGCSCNRGSSSSGTSGQAPSGQAKRTSRPTASARGSARRKTTTATTTNARQGTTAAHNRSSRLRRNARHGTTAVTAAARRAVTSLRGSCRAHMWASRWGRPLTAAQMRARRRHPCPVRPRLSTRGVRRTRRRTARAARGGRTATTKTSSRCYRQTDYRNRHFGKVDQEPRLPAVSFRHNPRHRPVSRDRDSVGI